MKIQGQRRISCFAVLFSVAAFSASAQDSGIGYPTVAAALEALKARSDVEISVQAGWTIVREPAAGTLWSFTPADHPAHPAAVKRGTVSRDGAAYINMRVLCQAAKEPCDQLVDDFKKLNEKIVAEAGRPAIAVAASNKDKQWRPTSAQIDLVQRQTYAYFSARDSGKVEEAYSRFAASFKQNVSFEQWSGHLSDTRSRLGEVGSRRIRKITWYQDPPQGPPGIFAAVDFSSQFANTAVHCGFVAWRQEGDGSFMLVREEENFIGKAQAQSMKPEEFETLRAQFGC